ncbi:hypothetical protein Hamer_G011305 [Homarus americanus]|uniref:Uncharacterized protein n=1 Tax=Homarus americanus TaxID=6706 RepID=A0A8J5MP51_HOMAM|nr:hypothetical protein Hamer_G011305 [Homarus americanus]
MAAASDMLITTQDEPGSLTTGRGSVQVYSLMSRDDHADGEALQERTGGRGEQRPTQKLKPLIFTNQSTASTSGSDVEARVNIKCQ